MFSLPEKVFLITAGLAILLHYAGIDFDFSRRRLVTSFPAKEPVR